MLNLRFHLLGLLAFLCLLSGPVFAAVSVAPSSDGKLAEQSRVIAEYAKVPMSFEANQGQTAEEVKFLAHGPGYTLLLKPDEAVLAFRESDGNHGLDNLNKGRPAQQPKAKPVMLRMRLVGANPNAEVTGLDELPGKVNYLRGKDQSQWHTGIATYRKTKIHQAYPGIDLVYYGNPQQMEYDFVVAPGADPKQILWSFESLGHSLKSRPKLAENGDMVIKTRSGEMRLRKPVVYQIIEGQRRAIEGRFQLRAADKETRQSRGTYASQSASQVGFLLADYDHSQPLVIDPEVVFSTYLGGSDDDYGLGIAVDVAGNAYVTGYTFSANFLGLGGGEGDAYITKLSTDGKTVIYSTFLGGSSDEWGIGIAVDSAGNAYVTGFTGSADFPTTVNAKYPQSQGGDAFVAKLRGDGQALIYSTYLGGSDIDFGVGIAVDKAGNVYVKGFTTSVDFPTVKAKYLKRPGVGLFYAFITKLSSDGQTVVYSTYLDDSSFYPGGGIAVDSTGNAYVTGTTNSADFPTVNAKYPSLWGGSDAYVFKLSSDGQTVVYSTYLGGSGGDGGWGIAVDSTGNAYVTGITNSTDFPTVNAKYQQVRGDADVFVTKLRADGQTLVYSTHLGGNSYDLARRIAVDGSGNAYVIGDTASVDFPSSATDPKIVSYDPTYNGGSIYFYDAFVFKINNNSPPLTATYGPSSPISQSGTAAEPVNTATGNYYYQHADLKLPGRGLPFNFTRTYNAQDSYSGPLGHGWTHSYNARLTENSEGAVVVKQGDGREEFFEVNGDGSYSSRFPGLYSVLVKNADGSFYLTDKAQTRQEFDSSGRLKALRDANSNGLSFNYDVNGDLTAITDTAGRGYTLIYDTNHRLTRLTDPIGRVIQYAYDANGDLTGVTDARGGVTAFQYDASHHLTRIAEPLGNVLVANVYDASGRVISQVNGRGFTTTFAYDAPNAGDTSITDALGQVTIHTHDGQRRLVAETDPLGNKIQYAYDVSNNKTQITDNNGKVTTYAYDANGNITQKTDALGGVTTLEYDAQNHPTRRVDALGNVSVFAYDTNGNLTQTTDALGNISKIAYDAYGQPVKQTDARGSDTLNSFDTSGNWVQVQDALGNKTTHAYDGAGRRVASTDAKGQVVSFAYDANDNLLQTTDPLGNITSFAYDANDNRISVTDALGRVTNSSYDANDLLTTVTDALGKTTRFAYDAVDRRISVTDPLGHATSFAYDAAGRLLKVTDALGKITAFTYDANGNRISQTNALGHVTGFTYDALNRLIATTNALGKSSGKTYDALGRVTQAVDANGRVTAYTYDAVGRLVKTTDPAGGVMTATYDAADNRTKVTDANGHATNYAYDALNRLTGKTDTLGNLTNFAYDAVGNRIELTDAKHQVLQYAYDANRRLIETRYPDASKVRFTYDAVGNRVQMADLIGTSFFQYDALHRQIQYTNPFGKTVASGYDAAGNRTALIYPGGKRVTYAYDALNRMKTVTDWLGAVTTYNYDVAGNLASTATPDSTTAAYAYDAAERLVQLSHARANASVIANYKLTLDNVGNRVGIDRKEPATTATLPTSATYTHDSGNRLLSISGSPVSHDNNGNLLTEPGIGLTYDFEDRLVDVSAGMHYRYDGLGNRLEASPTRYVLDTAGTMDNVLMETDFVGNPLAYYVHGLGLIARVSASGEARYYHFDPVGSTVALSNVNGNLTDTYAYDAFGQIVGGQASGSNPFRYVGQFGVMDEGNGLLFMRHRYMDSLTGRFVSQDPVSGTMDNNQTVNPYSYALNNPGRFVDYLGLSAREMQNKSNFYGSSYDAINEYILDLDRTEIEIRQILANFTIGLLKDAPNWKVIRDKNGIWKRSPRVGVAGKIAKSLPVIGIAADAYNAYQSNIQNHPERDIVNNWARASIDTTVSAIGSVGDIFVPGTGILISTVYDANREKIQENILYNPATNFVGDELYNLGHGNWLGNTFGF